MTLFKNRYRIESTRLKGYDYSSPGEYFVTVHTLSKSFSLGEVVDGDMRLSPAGQIIAEEWENTPKIRQDVRLDAWVVMPNHVHCIVVIEKSLVETHRDASLRVQNTFGPQRNTLGAIVRGFKSASAKKIHLAGFHDFGWQAGFYDHIVRDGKDLDRIREYIRLNPTNWLEDPESPPNAAIADLHHDSADWSLLD
jgi:putative transposase